MPFAVSLRADNESARSLTALWAAAAAFEAQPSMAGLGYGPHVTLAVYSEPPPLAPADILAPLVQGRGAPLRLRFAKLAAFDGPRPVLWAAPEPCPELDALHAALHGLIAPATCDPHYRPGAWVPHATIATQIDPARRAAALDFVARPIEPFELCLDAAEVVRFPPAEILESRRLG